MVNSPFLIQKNIKKRAHHHRIGAFYRKGKFMKFITIY